ncbi:ISBma1, transposase, interruption-N [Burkholderia pseudomallei]|nr:ISBma1, transposase, interruption-N [Burkholderia pseudomallei]
MLDRKALQALGCWTGYRLERVEWPQGDSRTLSLYLKPVSQIMYCEQCGARCQQIHETTVRRVRDLPLFEYRVVLHVPRRRVWCERCGAARLEKLDWLGRYQRVTERFAKACEKLLQAASVQAVAAFYELNRSTRCACARAWPNRTGRRSVIWRWTSSRSIKAIATPRWWLIRSADRSSGLGPDGHARRRAPSSNNSPKAWPSASKRSQST